MQDGRTGGTGRLPGTGHPERRPRGGARPPAQVYRDFGLEAAGTSPVQARVAAAVSASDRALRAIGSAPARRRQPPLILAALLDLALSGRAPELAAAFASGDGDAAARAAIDALLSRTDAVAGIAARRTPRTMETARCAVLHPAVAEAAHRAGADGVGLIGVDSSAGLDVHLDRVGVTYSDGRSLGDPSSPVQLSSKLVGDRPVPARALPEVVARIVVDRDPVDVTDPEDTRWLRACLAPDLPEQDAELQAALGVAAAAPPLLLRGDPVELLSDAVARVPADALPVVTTTWALSRFPVEIRRRFLHRLGEAAQGRPVAWVSAEGVGVAPGIPTFGDRPASGHSIVGVAVLDGATVRVEAVGRCWSRGRLLSWLADS